MFTHRQFNSFDGERQGLCGNLLTAVLVMQRAYIVLLFRSPSRLTNILLRMERLVIDWKLNGN